MSINGIPGYSPDILAPRTDANDAAGLAKREPAVGNVAGRATPANAPATAASTRPAPRATNALSAEAPEGTDPALWAVLTREERAFFSRAITSGPLTYGKMMRATHGPTNTPTARGGRVDVKV